MHHRHEKKSGARRGLMFLGWGAALTYFFDPQMGRTRRAKVRDKFVRIANRSSDKAERARRYASSEVYGLKQKIAHAGADEALPPNDQALAAKVESEVLRGDTYPKGSINVNAENGVVVLRGQLDDQSLIDRLEQEVRKVTGVIDVRNLMHVPGQPAPNKEAALEAD